MLQVQGLLSALSFASVADSVQAVDVTGNWRVTISTADGQMAGLGSLKQTGDKVTGWVGPSKDDPIPVEGTLKGNSLTLTTHPQPGRTVAFDKCNPTIDGDKMVGTIDSDKGRIEFVRNTPSS